MNKTDIDFASSESGILIDDFLRKINPDIIINCSGHFAKNTEGPEPSLSVNLGSNWSIVRYYIHNIVDKPIRIVMIGSSSYTNGKKNYILYSATKAALYNLWEGAKDYFADKFINIDLINPVRTKSKMTADCDPNLDYLEPSDVADVIKKTVDENLNSRCINIPFKL